MTRLLLIFISVLGFSQIIWQREIIDSVINASYFGRLNSLALDTSGIPGVVYYGDNVPLAIYYAVDLNDGWQKEVVDSGAWLTFGYSLVYDFQNIPHVSYYKVYAETSQVTYLCYATRDSLDWQIFIIDTFLHRFQDWGGTKTSIACDTAGQLSIAYVGHDSIEPLYIKYAHYNGVAWDTLAVDYNALSNCRDFSPSLKLDKHGNPHIAFLQSLGINRDTLKICAQDSLGNWVMRWAKRLEGGSAVSLELALDNNQYPCIAYDEGAALAYSWWDGCSLNTDYIAGIGWVGVRISLALDNNDNPHIVYVPDMMIGPCYCYKDGIWFDGVLDTSTGSGEDVRIRIDENNQIHAIYPCARNAPLNAIKHAWRQLIGINELTSNSYCSAADIQVTSVSAQDRLFLKYRISMPGIIELSIYDITGSCIVSRKSYVVSPGPHEEKIDMKYLSTGIYFVRLRTPDYDVVKKTILLR